MPQKNKKVLVIGAGPVMIGQGAELDSAAVQACQVLREKGYQIVVIDSNPAAVLTDRETADQIYIEPLNLDFIRKIIVAEKPDSILPVFGGQNALNQVYFLDREGLLEREGIQVLGASPRIINHTEDLKMYYAMLSDLGTILPKHGIAQTRREGEELGSKLGFPLIVKAAMAPEGSGVFTVYNQEELEEGLEQALVCSPIHQVLLAEALLGWTGIETEMIRDSRGCCRILAISEDINPVGVHSGDSMKVIPAQGLSRTDNQRIMELGEKILAKLAITGGVNLQFAFNPSDGRLMVLEVNPRFTMNTALASLATGLPLAALITKIALGETLEALLPAELPVNQEPVIFRIPVFDFEKFPTTEPFLNSIMKSTGAAVGIGDNFKAAFQKAVRASEQLDSRSNRSDPDEVLLDNQVIKEKVINANPEQLFFLRLSLKKGTKGEELAVQSRLRPWFLNELAELNAFERKLNTYALYNLPQDVLLQAKQWGYSDRQLAEFYRTKTDGIRKKRLEFNITPTYRILRNNGSIYSTYQSAGNAPASQNHKIILIGGGPNRIGQGSEFDHNLLQAAIALEQLGLNPIIVNCNPYSTAVNSRLPVYLEPLTGEDLLNILEREQPVDVICQMGGPLAARLGRILSESGVNILGTNPRLGDLIENPEQLELILHKIGLATIDHKTVFDSPTVMGAIGIEVDCISDGGASVICGMLEQIEEAGIHPGDSACSMPPYTLGKETLFKIRQATFRLVRELGIKGIVNLHYAVKQDKVYLMTVNPWAGRTIPFISKTTKVDWAKAAAKVLVEISVNEQKLKEVNPEFTAIKEVVLPFSRFPGADAILGPEMRSTGMVMGVSSGFGPAFIKSQLASGGVIPTSGTIFISIRNEERRFFLTLAKQLTDLGFDILAFDENCEYLIKNGVNCNLTLRPGEGRPNILDKIKNGEIQWIISTTSGRYLKRDEGLIRSTAIARGIPIITTLAAAQAGIAGVGCYIREGLELINLS